MAILLPLLVLTLSCATRFFLFGHPAAVVFDEVYFGTFLTNYAQHAYFFDIHPPLGKLILYAFGVLIGSVNAKVNLSAIGNTLPDGFIALRFIPTLAGALIPVVVYFLCRNLRLSMIASACAAFLLIFENSLLAQSRFLLIDSQLLLFGFTALWLYFAARNRMQQKEHATKSTRTWQIAALYIGASLCAGMAVSVKWTGLSFAGLIGLMELAYALTAAFHRSWKKSASALLRILGLILIVLATYTSLMYIHLSLLTKTGSGDAFMQPSFQKTLQGTVYNIANNPNLPTPTMAAKILELNITMYQANARLNDSHTYTSKWYTWPLMLRPIYFWNNLNEPGAPKTDLEGSMIYSLGNPLVYWLSSLAAFFGLLMAGMIVVRRKRFAFDASQRSTLWFLIIAYLANWLPFIFIGRVMFLYHYLAALIFAVMVLAFLFDAGMRHAEKIGKKGLSFSIATIAIWIGCLVFAAFMYWSPLTYGFHTDSLSKLFWLQSWR